MSKHPLCHRFTGRRWLRGLALLAGCWLAGGVGAATVVKVGACTVAGASSVSPDTVSNALATVASGGTVYVCPGTYSENNLNISRSLSLRSSSGVASDVTLQQTGANPYAPVLIVSQSGVTVSGVTIKDLYGYGGIQTTSAASALQLSAVKVTSGGHGVDLRAANPHLTSVDLSSSGNYTAALYLNGASGLILDGSSSLSNSLSTGYGMADNNSVNINPSISGASISGGYFGIYLQRAGTVSLSNSTISGGEGVRLLAGSGAQVLNNLSVSANSGYGIYLQGGSSASIVDVDAAYVGSGGYYVAALLVSNISGKVSIGKANKSSVSYSASASNNYGIIVCPASGSTSSVGISDASASSQNTAILFMGTGYGCGYSTVSLSNVSAVSSGTHGIAIQSGAGNHSFNNVSATGTVPNGYGFQLSGGSNASFVDVDATLAGTAGNYSAALAISNMGNGTVTIGTANKSQSRFSATGSTSYGIYFCGGSNTRLTLSNVAITSDNTALLASIGGCSNGVMTLNSVSASAKTGSGITISANGAHSLSNIVASGGSHGIWVSGNGSASGASYSNLTATSGTAGTNWVYGLYLGWQANASLTGANTVTGAGPNNVGVFLDYCTGCAISGATVDMGGLSGNYGMRLENSSNNSTVTGNLVRNAPYGGIYANASGISIIGNIVENSAAGTSWVYGIYAPYNSGVAYGNCLYTDSGGVKRNALSGGMTFYSGTTGNFWGSWPKGSGFSDSCNDSNGNGICNVNYKFDAYNNVDAYPLKKCRVQVIGSAAPLLAEYHLDEAAWTGAVNEVLDTSGNGRNGKAVGGTSLPTTAKATPALAGNPGSCGYGSFGGASSKQALDLGSIDLGLSNSNAFSVSAWARWSIDPATGNPWANIVTNNSNTSSDQGQFWIQHSNLVTTNDRFEFAIKTNMGRQYVSSATKPVVGQWYHLVGVYDGVAASIYVNGVLEASTAINGTIAPFDSTYQLTIGRWATGGPTYRAFQGNIDEVKIFGGALTQAQVSALYGETHACASIGPDHYELSLPSSGISCLPLTVSVTACANASSPCSSPATSVNGSVSLSSSAGSLGATSVSLSQGVGSTTLSHPAASNGAVVSVSLANEAPAASYSRKCCPDGGNCVVANSCSTTLSTAGFVVAASAGGSATSIANQVAGTTSSNYYLRAVKASDSNSQACQAALQGSNAVNFAYECVNPASCYGSNLMTVNGGAGATTISRNNSGSVASYQAVTLNFDANGNAPFTLAYGDVGQVALWANKTVNGAVLSASPRSFVVKPAAFNLSVGNCADGTANPAATSASGSRYCRAGQSFSATVSAVSSSGSLTPSFGRETTPESVLLSASLPAGLGLSNNPGISNGSLAGASFSNGVASPSNLAWNEVGIINLSAALTDGDYLGAGAVSSASVGVGRFYPDHFAVVSSALGHACAAGGFTYLGQDFSTSFTLAALSLGGSATQNYAGSFAKLGLSSWSGFVFTTASGSLAQGASATSGSAWAGGSSNVVAYHSLARPSAPTAASNVSISAKPVDSDGVTLSTATVVGSSVNAADGVAAFRFGRLQVANAFGSDKANLSLPVQAQYWSGNSWVVNGRDSCTGIPAAAVALSGQTGSLNSSNMSSSGNVNRPGGAATSLSNGRGNIILKCPYATCPVSSKQTAAFAGTVDVALNLGSGTLDASCLGSHPTSSGANLSWLRSNFGACATAQNKDPTARASFGVYAPETRKVVHVRELF